MRKNGIVARQNFMCCRTCASDSISYDISNLTLDRYEKIQGVCYYSKQNGLNSDDGVVRSIHLSYFRPSGYKYQRPVRTHTGLSLPELAILICDCLTKAGLTYEWDGQTETCIAVLPVQPGQAEMTQTAWDWLSVDPLG